MCICVCVFVDEGNIRPFRIYAKFFFNFFLPTKNSATDSQKSSFHPPHPYTPPHPQRPSRANLVSATAPPTPPRVGPATGTPPTAPTQRRNPSEYLRYPATPRGRLGPTSWASWGTANPRTPPTLGHPRALQPLQAKGRTPPTPPPLVGLPWLLDPWGRASGSRAAVDTSGAGSASCTPPGAALRAGGEGGGRIRSLCPKHTKRPQRF